MTSDLIEKSNDTPMIEQDQQFRRGLGSESQPQKSTTSPGTRQRNVLLLLVAFRLVNALTIRTFFQPDEFYQALEPAWNLVFGNGSGAWITWVWRNTGWYLL